MIVRWFCMSILIFTNQIFQNSFNKVTASTIFSKTPRIHRTSNADLLSELNFKLSNSDNILTDLLNQSQLSRSTQDVKTIKTENKTLKESETAEIDTAKNDEDMKQDELTTNDANVMVKYKIINLIQDTFTNVDLKITAVNNIHDMYKNKKLYEVGYVVSNIKKLKEYISNLVRFIEENREGLDLMKIFNIYLKVKKKNESITEMMMLLNFIMSNKRISTPLNAKIVPETKSGAFSWSYYDDTF